MKALINDPAILTGIVISGAHGIYEVHTDDGILRCTLRGKLKKAYAQAQSAIRGKSSARPNKSGSMYRRSNEKRDSNDPPVISRLSVGDYVKIRRLDGENGLIEEILPRQSEMSRLDAGSTPQKMMQQTLLANLDQVVVVLAAAQPEPHFGLLDRYLAICESTQLQARVCINKIDLPHEPRIEEMAQLYNKLGYTVLLTSTQSGEGVEQLRALLKNHTSLFTGPSGVGKSSLVNAIEPGMALQTGLVSDATGKGRHTTRGSHLYPLSGGGWLADSAGIRALAAWNIEPEELAWCFVEFRPYLGECEYSDCSHVDEEGCAIIQAMQDGVIDEHRYRSYVRIYRGDER